MKAAVLRKKRELSIEEKPTPEIGENEVLVRIRASGICGSDVHGFEGKIPDRRPPGIIMGHEASGEVVEVGKKVREFRDGERVAINPLIPCGDCYPCRRGWFHLCDHMLTLGSAMRVFLNGMLCEYVAVPPRQLQRLPPEVSFETGAMAEPASNAVHVLNRAALEVGSSVAVLGTGAIGLIAVQAAKIAGAEKVIAVDISPFRLEQAKRLGADRTVDASFENPVSVFKEETDGKGVDIAIEAAGYAVTYRDCIEGVRKRGKVMAFGFIESEVAFPMRTIIYREVSLVGCTAFSYEIETALSLIASGKLNVKALITHHFPLEEAQKAFETAADSRANAIKVMVIP